MAVHIVVATSNIPCHKLVKNSAIAFQISCAFCFIHSHVSTNACVVLSQFIIAKTIKVMTAIIATIIAIRGSIDIFKALDANVNNSVAVAHILYAVEIILIAVLTTPIAIAIANKISATIGFSANHLNISTKPLNISSAKVPMLCPISNNASTNGCQSILAIFSDISLNLSEQLFSHS